MTTNETITQTNCTAIPTEIPQRYEIWTASFPKGGAIQNCRPVIIVGTNEEYRQVTVIPMTSRLCYRQKSTHVLVEGQGLLSPGRALGEIVTTLPCSCLVRRIGCLTEPFDRCALRHALATHLGLSEADSCSYSY